MLARQNIIEEASKKAEAKINSMDSNKLDLKLYIKQKKQLDLKNLEQDIKIFKNTNHVATIDNYLDKYLPIRT